MAVLVLHGPNPSYVEPFDTVPSLGFCVALETTDYSLGSPEFYARSKATLFPSEGGPVILELELDEKILHLSETEAHDYQFERGHGIEELLNVWREIPKRIRVLAQERH
jgi:hypothetical protein